MDFRPVFHLLYLFLHCSGTLSFVFLNVNGKAKIGMLLQISVIEYLQCIMYRATCIHAIPMSNTNHGKTSIDPIPMSGTGRNLLISSQSEETTKSICLRTPNWNMKDNRVFCHFLSPPFLKSTLFFFPFNTYLHSNAHHISNLYSNCTKQILIES